MSFKNKIANDTLEFAEYAEAFMLYNPVKVSKVLKEDFNEYLKRHFTNVGIKYWSLTIFPLKKSYKFQRTK